MFCYQFKRLFGKYFFAVLIFIFVCFISKIYILNSFENDENYFYLDKKTSEYYDRLVELSEGMTLEECCKFINNYQLENSEKLDKAQRNAVSRYRSDLQNLIAKKGEIDYCRTGSGIVSPLISDDVKSIPELLKKLDTPTVVNPQHFLKFLKLQSGDIFVIFLLIMVGFSAADDYEKRMNIAVDISKNSKSFYKNQEIIFLIMIFVFFTLNFIIDLLLTGNFNAGGYKNATIQSAFNVRSDVTIIQTIIWLYFTRLFAVIISYQSFMIIAKKACSVKMYMIFAFGLIFLMSSAAVYLPFLSPYLFSAVGDKTDMISNIDYIKNFGISEMSVSAAAYLILICGLGIFRRR